MMPINVNKFVDTISGLYIMGTIERHGASLERRNKNEIRKIA